MQSADLLTHQKNTLPWYKKRISRKGLWLLLFGLPLLIGGGWELKQTWKEAHLREAYLPELEAQARSQPTNGRLLTLLGARLAESGKYPEAAEMLTNALGAGEKDPLVWLSWAASIAAAGNRPQAEGALKLAIRDAPQPEPLKEALARVQSLTADASPQQVAQAICPGGSGKLASLYAQGNFLNGLAEWWGKQSPDHSGYMTRQKWAEAEPKNAQAQRLWSEALARNGRYEDAVDAAKRALELDPKSPATHLALANAYYHGGAVSKAGLEYIAALKIRPDWLPALRGLGNVALEKKLLQIATDVFERAVKQAPDDADLWVGLGRAYYNQRTNLARALEAFQTAERLAPKRTDYFADYSTALRANFKDAEAEALLRKRLAEAPQDGQCLFLLGLALLDLNPTPERLTEAEKTLRASLELSPDQPAAAAQLGRLLLDRGKPQEAITLLTHAIDLDPYNAIAMKSLPRAYRLAGHRKEFESAQKRWLSLSDYVQKEAALNDRVRRNPLDVQAYEELAKLYVGVGEKAKAQNQLDMIYVLKNHRQAAEKGLSALVRATNLTVGAEHAEPAPKNQPAASSQKPDR